MDYLESVELLKAGDEGLSVQELVGRYDPAFLEGEKSLEELEGLFERYPALPSAEVIARLQEGLMEAWPVKDVQPQFED